MGWLFTQGLSKSDLIQKLIKTEENETRRWVTLTHSVRGNVLWSVVELTYKAEQRSKRFIACHLLRSDKGYGWGYKDMEESMGPAYYSCPLKYLEMAPEANAAWREAVREHHLGTDRTQAFGVEYDHERAWHAKQILDRCIHGDVQECNLGLRQFSLLWLNPPYGNLVSDKGSTGDHMSGKGRKRLEKLFYNLTVPTLQFDGVLVFIIPRSVLDKELVSWITNHFRDVTVFKAPEQRFKQIVLFGIRRRTKEAAYDTSGMRERLLSIVAGETEPETLPEVWQSQPYVVPASVGGEVKFNYVKLDSAQLADEINRHRCLWDQFDLKFRLHDLENVRRPLRKMTDWHLAQALVAGQVSGLVRSKDGRRLLVKGGTHKEKMKEVLNETSPEGDVTSTTIFTDRFVPTIRAIDFTPGVNFARVIEIR